LPPHSSGKPSKENTIHIHQFSWAVVATLDTLSLGVKVLHATPTPKIINGRYGSGPIKFIANSFVPAKLFLIVLGN